MAKVKTQKELLGIFREIHGDKYKYPSLLTDDKLKSKEKIKIICPVHGEFEQTVTIHMKGSGCKQCFIDRCSKPNKSWLKDFKLKHGDKYLYPTDKWPKNVKLKTKVTITCRDHGDFEQIANNHYNGAGCPDCGLQSRSENRRTKTEEWLTKFNDTHGCRYLYPTEEWPLSFNIYQNIPIICREHGVFTQMVNHHRDGSGCPDCAGTNHVYAYIFNVEDMCLKFGITGNVLKRKRRLNQINKIKIELIDCWKFSSSNNCRNAEREIYENVTKVMPKETMPDGYTETCSVDFFEYIIGVYKKYGGVKI